MQHNHIYHPYKDGHQVDPSRPIFYVIQNTKTGIYYAGYKKNKKRFLIEKGYTTSSNIVNEIIQNEGLAIWRIMKIRYFESGKEAKAYEVRFLCRIDAKRNVKFYNKSNDIISMINPGHSPTEKHRKVISEYQKNKVISNETRKKHSEASKRNWSNMQYREKTINSMKRRKPISEETRKKMSIAASMRKGEKRSDEAKFRMKEAQRRLAQSKKLMSCWLRRFIPK